MRIAILGAGYTGRALAAELVREGHEVLAVGRSDAPLVALSAALGEAVTPRAADTQDTAALRAALEGTDRLVHLAPVPRDGPPEDDAGRVLSALPARCDRIVYGSTTGVFQQPADPETWVDEDWPAGPKGKLGRARLAYETTLIESASAPVFVVRIAGIYGPGRTQRAKLEAGEMVLFEGATPTSRIHRDDLARILSRMVLEEAPPPKLVACDELPCPTVEVARYTASLLGLPMPPVLSREEAEARLSERARELRMSGKKCRSLHRRDLVGPLMFPSFREGVRSALEEEGKLAAQSPCR